jgi:hypothetical protein
MRLGAPLALACLALAGCSKSEVVIDTRGRLSGSPSSIVYTLTSPGANFTISVESDSPVDWAVLPTQADLAFPHMKVNVVEPFIAMRTMRDTRSGYIPAGKVYLEINADRHGTPVVYDLKTVKN